jgi:hypothetical protein
MAKVLYVADKQVKRFTPVYNASGQWTHGITRLGPTEYLAERRNRKRYQTEARSATFADQASALAWCQTDYNTVLRPDPIAPTTTTASYVQPALDATVVIAVASATGMVVGQAMQVGPPGGKYVITAIAGLNVTVRNPANAWTNVGPGVTVASGSAVQVVGSGAQVAEDENEDGKVAKRK